MSSARALIRELQEDGLLDELGFGVLQNAIAERLYPATTTIMTACRYLYFLPALHEQLENKRTSSRQFEERMRELQFELRGVLKETEGPGRGVIGYDAGRDLKRVPSNIYWNGMRRLGLFRRNWSESSYRARLDAFYAEAEPQEDDDGALHASQEQSLWDPTRPSPTFLDAQGRFKHRTNFQLTRAEARDLFGRYDTCFPDSLLTYLVRHGIPELPSPWDLPHPPSELDLVLRHARALSAFAQGVTLQYYALLLDERVKRGLRVPDVDLPEAFTRWYDEAWPVLKAWDLKQFLTLPFIAGGALRLGDPTFLTDWRTEALAQPNASALFLSTKGRQLVHARELRVKPSKARLRFPSYLEAWDPSFLGRGRLDEYGLYYRHRIGQRFTREILEGLRGEEV